MLKLYKFKNFIHYTLTGTYVIKMLKAYFTLYAHLYFDEKKRDDLHFLIFSICKTKHKV